MRELPYLVKRNCKLFFKDKGSFFTSLITPLILLVLYVTFLADVYRDSFATGMGNAISVPEELIEATVGGQLFSSLLAVCCVTVAFCANMLMVSDKVTGARQDLTMTPVKSSTLSLGYFLASALSTLIICLVATGACFLYLANVGWYLTLTDVALILLDVVLLTLFGTALSSIINTFMSSQGQIQAVGTIVSSGYGFICGAYMPISQFGEGLQRVISFLPGTYGTSLLRNHTLRGVFQEMEALGFPKPVMENLKSSIDCNLYFFDSKVDLSTMLWILSGSVLLLMGGYVFINILRSKSR